MTFVKINSLWILLIGRFNNHKINHLLIYNIKKNDRHVTITLNKCYLIII